MLQFLDAFRPTEIGPADRKLAFRGWAALHAQVNRLGFKLTVSHDLGCVRRFWEALPEDRRAKIRMPPVQDTDFHPDVGPGDSVVVFATRDGETAPSCMIGSRRIWLRASMSDMMEDLSFWYGGQAERMHAEGRRCRVTAPSARVFESDYIAWLGGGMNLSNNPVVYRASMRAVLFYICTHWHFKATAGIVERSTFRIHGIDWYGFSRSEIGIWRDKTEFLLASTPRLELVREMAQPGFTDIDAPLLGRRPEEGSATDEPARPASREPALIH